MLTLRLSQWAFAATLSLFLTAGISRPAHAWDAFELPADEICQSTATYQSPIIQERVLAIYKGHVTQNYRAGLNREPDCEGLAYWVNEITSKRQTTTQVQTNLFHSGEGCNYWVTLLYTDALGRQPDEAGKAHWMNICVSQSMTISQMHQAFLNSTEYASNH